MLLPAPLRLRKEIEQLTESVQDLPSEQEARDAARELNHRIAQWRRIPIGPPVFVPMVDEEALAERWRQARTAAPVARSPDAPQEAALGATAPGRRPSRRDRPGQLSRGSRRSARRRS